MSSSIKQCKRCKQLFHSNGLGYCPECVVAMEQEFVRVKEYVYEHQSANVEEIAEVTEVPEKTILYFLREGRLSISESNGVLTCQKCGRSIPTGRYCATCTQQLERSLASAARPAASRGDKTAGNYLGGIHSEYKNR